MSNLNKEQGFIDKKVKNIDNNISSNIYFLDETETVKKLFSVNKNSYELKLSKYCSYFCARFFRCCYKNEVISFYENEIIRVKKLLDLKLFSNYLLQQYTLPYKK